MKIQDIQFEGCCGEHGYAEVPVSSGFLAIMKSHADGSFKVRQFDASKMPLGSFEPVTEDQLQALLG